MEENEQIPVSETNSGERPMAQAPTETTDNAETAPESSFVNENNITSAENTKENSQQEPASVDEATEKSIDKIESKKVDIQENVANNEGEDSLNEVEKPESPAEILTDLVEGEKCVEGDAEFEQAVDNDESVEVAHKTDDENNVEKNSDEVPAEISENVSEGGKEQVANVPLPDTAELQNGESASKQPENDLSGKACPADNESSPIVDNVEMTAEAGRGEGADLNPPADIDMIESEKPVENSTKNDDAMEVDKCSETESATDSQKMDLDASSKIVAQSEVTSSDSDQQENISNHAPVRYGETEVSKESSSQMESVLENSEEISSRVSEESGADKEKESAEKEFQENNQVSSSTDAETKMSVSECQTEDGEAGSDIEIEEPSLDKPKLVLLSSSLMSSSAAPHTADPEPDVYILPHPDDGVGEPSKPPSVMRPPDLKLVASPIPQLCTHCKQVKHCGYKLGNYPLCSVDCHKLLLTQTAEALAQRVCRQCRSSISSTQFIWESMDFCSDICIAHHQMFIGSRCTQCDCLVPSESLGKLSLRFGCEIKQFCGRACFDQFKRILPLCSFCDDSIMTPGLYKLESKEFCTNACLTKYQAATGRGSDRFEACAVCSKNQPVVIEVQQGDRMNPLCSEPCFSAFKFVNNINEVRCDQCQKFFDKILSDKIMIFMDEWPLQFCARTCLNIFMLENRRVMQCIVCKVKKNNFDLICKATPAGSIHVCSLMCLRTYTTCPQCGRCGNPRCEGKLPGGSIKYFCTNKCGSLFQEHQKNVKLRKLTEDEPVNPQVYQHILTKPKEYIEMKNKGVLCKPFMHNKGTSCRPMPCHRDTQTDESLDPPHLIPIPVPIYVPAPMAMYSTIFPVPVPVPLPLPIPIFIPTTRNSAKGILKEIRKIHDKMPADPFEAELLMMAEMVAGDRKLDITDSESDREDAAGGDVNDTYSPEPVDTNNSFGDDIMQMALFASDLAEPQVDMESVLTSNTITPSQHSTDDKQSLYGAVAEESPHTMAMRNRKRPARGGRGGGTPQQNKRGRRSNTPNDVGMHNMHNMGMGHLNPPEPQRIEVEKPDAHLQLKYTFGVNAWRHWVMQKNQELEKAMLSNRKIKPFKPDLLQLTADELNFSLCLFVKEVKKPNGQEYAPDTIYYLCLGIQQYLFENNRIDNIFTDIYYEKFTDCLDEVAKKFSALYNDSQFIVTRVEEEHLWESRQLGAHSPHVLLSTLMFFNTKHFNLLTVEEHMQLSFSHIMKHWKRNPNTPGMVKVPGSRNVLLRFYPPQAALEANSRKKKVYEQLENEVDPLRCPVKLYEFYLSKCPESVKTRNDVFYLLPERSCVPDSPVWYSTMALGKEPLMKMLHRVKMVKEINVALLDS